VDADQARGEGTAVNRTANRRKKFDNAAGAERIVRSRVKPRIAVMGLHRSKVKENSGSDTAAR